MDLVEDVVDTDRRADRLHVVVPVAELPHLIVRVTESYVYLSLLTGAEPEPERAARVLHALLPPARPAEGGPMVSAGGLEPPRHHVAPAPGKPAAVADSSTT